MGMSSVVATTPNVPTDQTYPQILSVNDSKKCILSNTDFFGFADGASVLRGRFRDLHVPTYRAAKRGEKSCDGHVTVV